MLCQNLSTTTVCPEQAVVIASDWSVTPITTGGLRGHVGIVADYAKGGLTSANVSTYQVNQAFWVQVYGRSFVQVMGSTSTSPSDAANGPTTVQTSAFIKFKAPTSATTPIGSLILVSDTSAFVSGTDYKIIGLWVAQDSSAADVSVVTTVSATHTGNRAAVWLNYPSIEFYDATS